MKKLIALGLSLVMILSLAACGKETPSTAAPTEAPTTAAPTEAPTTAAPTTEAPTTEPVPEVKILSYEEYLAAEKDSEVTIEAYVQFTAYNAKYGNASLFLADADGGYFVYRMNVTPEEAALLTEGTKIRVHGFKTEWSGEVEFSEGESTFEVVEGGDTYVAEAADVTALFGTDKLIGYMNQKVSVSGAVVEASKDADGNEKAFLYKWNGTGVDGDDLYFNVSLDGKTYTLTVESDEWGAGTDVYEAVKNLNVGDEINLEGFLYWYEGPQPHISAVTVIMNYEQFSAAEKDAPVAVKAYVQFAAYNAKYGNVSLFLADADGGYFVYRMNVTPEEAALLTEGTLICVRGFKTEWSGEVEFSEGESTFKVVKGGDTYVAEAADVTALFGTDELIGYMNQKVSIKGAVVEASKDADGNEKTFLYKWNGTGVDGDDLYFNVSLGGKTYTLTVESDEWGAGSEVYEAVKALSVGDKIDLSAFLYWYEGPQPHVAAVKAAE